MGSRGFFQREEVQSLVAFLRALSDPHDGNVVAMFLRSLFCTLTDEEFLVLRASHPDEVFAGWKHFVEQNPEHAPLLETFEQLLRIKNLVSPGRLVREIIQRCHFDYFLTTFPDAQVRWVNVHKFVEFCDGFEGSTGLRDFINRSGIAQQVKESEASVENEESDVVRVMTVHQSKGLEFPIVIVPELGQQSRSQNSEHMLSDPMYNRIAFAPPSHKPREGSEYEQLCEREKLREEHEERRLLYVAFTRACNKLALSFSGKPRKNTPYLGFLQQADLLESSGTWSGSGEGNGPLREFVRHVSLPDLQQVQPYQLPTITCAPEEIPPTVLPLEQAPIKRYISPTPMLQALREGRALFVESSNGEEQETPFKNPGELGKLCHKVLEKLAILPLAAFNHALVQSVARQEGYDASVVEPACSLVLPLKTAGIPLLEKLSNAPLLFTEKPLRKHWKDYILTGTVDLLFSQGGEWHLVDFKSSAFHRQMVQETYRFQVQFYLFLLQELVHPAPQKGHLIFLRDNHVETVHMQQEFEQELEDKVRAYQSLLQKP